MSTRRDFCRNAAGLAYGVAYTTLLSLTALTILPVAAQQVHESRITITNAYGSLGEDRMGALFRFRSKIELADVVVEALQNSIPLLFVFQCRVVDKDTWFAQEILGEQTQLIELRYTALLDHYTLKHTYPDKPEESVTDSYPTLASALTFLVAVETFPVNFKHALPEINDKEKIRLQARLKLDVDALPAPLRPYAFANNSWDVDSDWFDWPVAL